MRRILRKIASRQLDELGDTSTLAEPNVVTELIELADSWSPNFVLFKVYYQKIRSITCFVVNGNWEDNFKIIHLSVVCIFANNDAHLYDK